MEAMKNGFMEDFGGHYDGIDQRGRDGVVCRESHLASADSHDPVPNAGARSNHGLYGQRTFNNEKSKERCADFHWFRWTDPRRPV